MITAISAQLGRIPDDNIPEEHALYVGASTMPLLGAVISFFFQASLTKRIEKTVAEGNQNANFLMRNFLMDRVIRLESLREDFRAASVLSGLLGIVMAVVGLASREFQKAGIFINPYVFTAFILFEIYVIYANAYKIQPRIIQNL